MTNPSDVLIVENELDEEQQQAFFNEDGSAENDELCKVMQI